MRLFDLFGKGGKEQLQETEKRAEENEQAELTAYSGMRVEVTTFEGNLLFVAKLTNLWKDQARLEQYSESELSEEKEEEEPLHVRIRGYSDHERKAVYMEGVITLEEKHTWKVEELTVARIGNDRAFFRLETNLDAVVTTFGGFSAREHDCKMLNISVGGARILSEEIYQEGDKFLLQVKLLEDRPMSVMFCEVLRIFEREDSKYEYGCRFLELNEEDQDKITQNIFAAQLAERRKQRGAQ